MAAILGSPILGWLRFPSGKRAKPLVPERREPKVLPPVPDLVDEIPVPQPQIVTIEKGRAIDAERILAATRETAIDLAPIEWDGDKGVVTARELATADPASTIDGDPRGGDAKARRIRDRYITARFPGVARAAADLEATDRVIKAARLFFEDGDLELALELLDLAIEQNSRAEALWLAQMEILFLSRQASRFAEAARAFHAMHPASEAWPEIGRLGRALVPGDPLFGAASGPRDHEHYGPWPDLPNWIQANWDLTAEVVAADFHRLMKQRAAQARAARLNPPLAA